MASRSPGAIRAAPPRPSAMPQARFEFGTPDAPSRVRASFARQGAMATIGASLDAVEPGYCAISLVPHAGVSQQHGYVHAGIVAAIVDSAGGYAGYSLFPANASVLTVEFKLNLLAPAEGERIVAEGFVVKPGRTLCITRGEVHAESRGRRRLCALMQQTLMLMHGKDDGDERPAAARRSNEEDA